MAEVFNNQRKIPLDVPVFGRFAASIREAFPEIGDRSFTVAFISDARMKQLNRDFRDKNETTDVLSFPSKPDEFDPNPENLGDIAISVEQAQKQALENGLDFDTEIKQLILHGVLHLCGYDHETDDGEMNTRELELREALGI